MRATTSTDSPRLVRVRAIAAVTVACLGLNGFASQTQRTAPAVRQRFAYTTTRPLNWDVFLFSGVDGRSERITDDPGLEYDPVLSPDGRWVVFTSEKRGNPDLYVMELSPRGAPRLLIDADSMEDQATFSADGKRLAFVSTSSGNADVYVIDFDPQRTHSMGEALNLTRSPSADLRPAFSPDGQSLIFTSDRDEPISVVNPITRLRGGEIYLLELKTSRLKRLTQAAGWDGSAAWSPDGKHIVFYSQRALKPAFAQQQARIWTMDADGSNQHVVVANDTLALSPEFLSSEQIAYSRKTADGTWELVAAALDGTDVRVLSNSVYWGAKRGPSSTFVAFGPSGETSVAEARRARQLPVPQSPGLVSGAPFRRLIDTLEIDELPIRGFTALLSPIRDELVWTAPGGPGSELMLSALDGSNRRQLIALGAAQGTFDGLSWARDGEWLYFTQGDHRQPERDGDIWRVRRDGTDRQNITPDTKGSDTHPAACGRDRVVFRSARDGQFDLYVMRSDGSDVRRLTNDPGNELFPVCSPDGRRVAFISDRDKPGSRIYEVYAADLADGLINLHRITRNDVQEGHPAFSPDGEWVVFASEDGGINDEEPLVQSVVFGAQSYGEIYAHHLSTQRTIRLTHNKWEEGIPSWEAGVSDPTRR
jgi:Tol biopolymer transport system component